MCDLDPATFEADLPRNCVECACANGVNNPKAYAVWLRRNHTDKWPKYRGEWLEHTRLAYAATHGGRSMTKAQEEAAEAKHRDHFKRVFAHLQMCKRQKLLPKRCPRYATPTALVTRSNAGKKKKKNEKEEEEEGEARVAKAKKRAQVRAAKAEKRAQAQAARAARAAARVKDRRSAKHAKGRRTYQRFVVDFRITEVAMKELADLLVAGKTAQARTMVGVMAESVAATRDAKGNNGLAPIMLLESEMRLAMMTVALMTDNVRRHHEEWRVLLRRNLSDRRARALLRAWDMVAAFLAHLHASVKDIRHMAFGQADTVHRLALVLARLREDVLLPWEIAMEQVAESLDLGKLVTHVQVLGVVEALGPAQMRRLRELHKEARWPVQRATSGSFAFLQRGWSSFLSIFPAALRMVTISRVHALLTAWASLGVLLLGSLSGIVAQVAFKTIDVFAKDAKARSAAAASATTDLKGSVARTLWDWLAWAGTKAARSLEIREDAADDGLAYRVATAPVRFVQHYVSAFFKYVASVIHEVLAKHYGGSSAATHWLFGDDGWLNEGNTASLLDWALSATLVILLLRLSFALLPRLASVLQRWRDSKAAAAEMALDHGLVKEQYQCDTMLGSCVATMEPHTNLGPTYQTRAVCEAQCRGQWLDAESELEFWDSESAAEDAGAV